jgi:hypothetical protein
MGNADKGVGGLAQGRVRHLLNSHVAFGMKYGRSHPLILQNAEAGLAGTLIGLP